MMPGVDGNGPKRFSVQRKMAIVARLLRGEPLELVVREMNVSIARLSEWRDRALTGAATALKERERDDRDDEIAAHHARELAGDGEAEPGAAEALRGRGIGLGELLEQLRLLLRRHADAGIGHGELDPVASVDHPSRLAA